MKVILVTRCDCRKEIEIPASEAPPGIQVEMDLVPDNWPDRVRRFSFFGKHQVSGHPMYIEDLPERTDGEVIDGVFTKQESESDVKRIE